MTDYPQRNLTGLVIGNFAYKAKGITEGDGGLYYFFQIRKHSQYSKTMAGEKSITDNPYVNTP